MAQTRSINASQNDASAGSGTASRIRRKRRAIPSFTIGHLQPIENHPGDLLPPGKVLHLHAKRADGKRNVVGEADKVLLRRDRGQARGLPGDPFEVPPAVRVMVRKREEPLDPESRRRQGVAELRVPGQPGERKHDVPDRGTLRGEAVPPHDPARRQARKGLGTPVRKGDGPRDPFP
jgi:hypothetical protein